MNQPVSGVPGRRARWIQWLRVAFGALAAAWLLKLIVTGGALTRLSGGDWKLWQTWLFICGYGLLPVGLALLWRWTLLFSANARLGYGLTLTTQALAWAGRYLPGKAGLWLAKLTASEAAGADWRQLSRTVLVEQLFFVLAGFVFYLLVMPAGLGGQLGSIKAAPWLERSFTLIDAPAFRLTGVLLFVLAAAVSVFIISRLLRLQFALQRLSPWSVVFCGHVLLHAIAGASLYFLLTLLAPDSAAHLGIAGVASLFALANCAGIIAVFAPAGLGVRELVLAAGLTTGMSFESGLEIAAYLRLLTVFADGLFCLLAWVAGTALQRFE